MRTIAELSSNSKCPLPRVMLGGRERADLRGKKYDLLTIVEFAGADSSGSRWLCKCDCGGEKTVRGASLTRGASGSCGCRRYAHLHPDRGSAPPLKANLLYPIWKSMIYRCTNPKSEAWNDYGARGIFVADEWLDFNTFVADMSPRPAGHQIDRINNSLGYSKSNCRWATPKENCRNRRDNVLVEFEGRIVTVAEASELSGIPRYVLYSRIKSNNADIFRAIDLRKGAHNKNNRNWEKRVTSGRQVKTAAAVLGAQP